MKEPCINCDEKNIDEYGYFCDIACGKRTAWGNHQVGMKEIVEWIRRNAIYSHEPSCEYIRIDRKEWTDLTNGIIPKEREHVVFKEKGL